MNPKKFKSMKSHDAFKRARTHNALQERRNRITKRQRMQFNRFFEKTFAAPVLAADIDARLDKAHHDMLAAEHALNAAQWQWKRLQHERAVYFSALDAWLALKK